MPDYEIVGIYCDAIASAGGAIHCTTIGIGDHIEDYEYDATVSAVPVTPPIIIPASGGSFDFDASLANNEADSIFTEVWSEITLPSGTVFGPILDRGINMPVGGSAGRTLMQAIPGSAPAGTYTYTLYTGERLPRVVNDESSFTFEKTGVLGDGSEKLVGYTVREIASYNSWEQTIKPDEFIIIDAYPNPFNPTTEISFNLPSSGMVELSVYNLQGAEVADLLSGQKEAGSYRATFDATNFASGVYFAKLNFAGNTSMQKLVLIK